MVVQDWSETVYQIEDPYPLTNGGQNLGASGPAKPFRYIKLQRRHFKPGLDLFAF